MLVEELRALPNGAHVIGKIEFTREIPGVVESMKGGPHFIRWADGYVSFPFGWVQEYDEYIAARTEIEPSRYSRIHLETNGVAVKCESTPSVEEEQAISA